MNLKKIIIASLISTFLFTGCTTNLDAQEPQFITVFFNNYKNNQDGAIDKLFVSNKFIDVDSPGVVNLKKQLRDLTFDLGKYYGYELLGKQYSGESSNLVIYSYMLKYERQPIRFQFVMYRPNEDWQLLNFQYDVDLDEELIKASRLYFNNNTYEEQGL
jgi:hypothetical protein